MTTLVTTRGHRSPIRASYTLGRTKPSISRCDECGKDALVYSTGRERVRHEGVKREYLCEHCIAALSTDPDPFRVMEAEGGEMKQQRRMR